MANKRYDQFATVTPTTSRIILHADPATGALGKCTISDELNLQPPVQTLLSSFQALGSPILSIGCAINPIPTSGSVNMGNGAIWWIWNMLPACTVSGVWFSLGALGVFTATNFNGFALYSNAGGTLTQIAITANNANFFKAATGAFQQAVFTSPVTVTAGNYWIGLIWSSSATSATPALRAVAGTTNFVGQALNFSNNEKTISQTGSGGTLPASILWSVIPAGNYVIPILGLY